MPIWKKRKPFCSNCLAVVEKVAMQVPERPQERVDLREPMRAQVGRLLVGGVFGERRLVLRDKRTQGRDEAVILSGDDAGLLDESNLPLEIQGDERFVEFRVLDNRQELPRLNRLVVPDRNFAEKSRNG